MSVFTAYFCGTGSHRFDKANPAYWNGELVSTLASHDQGREFAQWVAVDGPGSGNLQDDQLFVEPGGYFNWTGQLFGHGWQENVAHVLQMIKGRSEWQRTRLSEEEYQRLKRSGIGIPDAQATASWFWRTYDYGQRHPTPQALQERIIRQFRKPLIPTQVNLVGWSRGGISCHMLANAMAADPELAGVPVRIFAVDPVPGAGNVQPERAMLGANVKEYVGFYSRDERSMGFACVVPTVAPGTRLCVYPMPGRHATLVGNASLDGAGEGKALPQPGLVVRHFAERCLTRWGVTLDKCLNLSAQDVAAYHAAMKEDDAKYCAMRTQSYTMVTEGTLQERMVYRDIRLTEFTQVRGEHMHPSDGLSIQGWDPHLYRPLA